MSAIIYKVNVPVHATNAYKKVVLQLQLHSFLTPELYEGEWPI